jgi:hypothetical protein
MSEEGTRLTRIEARMRADQTRRLIFRQNLFVLIRVHPRLDPRQPRSAFGYPLTGGR